jgi:hypothetical protein
MTAEDQLDWVARYFRPWRGRLAGIPDLYMAHPLAGGDRQAAGPGAVRQGRPRPPGALPPERRAGHRPRRPRHQAGGLSLAPVFPGWVAIPRPPEPKWERVKARRLAHDPTATTSPPLSVNAWVNRHVRYVADLKDRWQPPGETLKLGTGDCEDFAILKRAILINRGWPAGDLAMLVVKDLASAPSTPCCGSPARSGTSPPTRRSAPPPWPASSSRCSPSGVSRFTGRRLGFSDHLDLEMLEDGPAAPS